jgi:hypothetical protein
MNCDSIPDTGGPQFWALVAALGLLVAGCLVLVLARRGRMPALGLLFVAILGASLLTDVGPAQAERDCDSPGGGGGADNSLTITQTSIIEGLAPDRAPQDITGRVLNRADDDTYIVAIDVSISSVTKAPGAASGTCDSSDYVLLNPRMPVGQALGPFASVGFSGASIGFEDSAINQDACKGATVNLLYVSDQGPSVQPD